MRDLFIYSFLTFFLFVNCYSQTVDQLKYLQQNPPSITPEVFAPEIISKTDEYEFGSVFSKDGTELFYGVDVGNRSEIRYTKLEGKSWKDPITIIYGDTYGFNDPFLSPEEDKLYYISDKPVDNKGQKNGYDIWYSEKTETGWSDPINAGPSINTRADEYYISFTDKGTMYFSSNKNASQENNGDFDIYASKRIDGEFQKATKLSNAINTKAYEADVFVAPDESYLIFCATRKNGLGRGDLYISFKQKNGEWTESKNMGAVVNSDQHELCPFVTKDGKYFFYTSNKDIYWVDAKILETYR